MCGKQLLRFRYIQHYKMFLLAGIFAYLNYLAPRTRREVIDILIKGLQRLEYRGYDSAGKSSFLSLLLVLGRGISLSSLRKSEKVC